MNATRDRLLARLNEQKRRLAQLERDREEAHQLLEAIQTQLSSLPSIAEPVFPIAVSEESAPAKPAEKVRLFRSLFRGREEVFPTRFVSKRTGKPGYAPACSNKFVPGVCELPRIKCGECPNQAFVPFTDQAVLDHLQGRHVMGVYPLLPDETCWFLAVDFDKAD